MQSKFRTVFSFKNQLHPGIFLPECNHKILKFSTSFQIDNLSLKSKLSVDSNLTEAVKRFTRRNTYSSYKS